MVERRLYEFDEFNKLDLDEEVGGFDGMRKFVHTKDFQNLNVGVALDEGMASPTEEFALFNGERSIWRKFLSSKTNLT